ncbi:MAG: hypothetical protein OEY57_18595, partial [Nitrospirota bacterium]|nr:hypothetical protein [Nitrospirota bacterium]
TLNAGKDWVDRPRTCGSPCLKPADLVNIQFRTQLSGRIIGERGTILMTEDAGFTWQEVETLNTETLYGLSLPDAVNGFAVGDHGTILHFTPTPAEPPAS